MKVKFILSVFLMLSFSYSFGTNKDSISISNQDYIILSETVKKISRDYNIQKNELLRLSDSMKNIKSELMDISDKINQHEKSMFGVKDSLKQEMNNTQVMVIDNAEFINKDVSKRSTIGLWICIGLALALGIISLIYWVILTKRKDELKTLSEKADKINEEIVNRMSSEINEMQSISKQIASISNVSGGNSDSEQALIKTLADRITFMEMTLYKMDSSVRGHRQLSRSIKQMKDNLLANGYELVDMLGKDYHEGMKVTANFIEDETLPEGKQKITGIIKPQINYRGKMIQSAQITVSQNL